MDGWLKVLVAAACAVVIAAGGYYGISEYRRASAQAARELNEERALNELFRLASAGENDVAKVWTFCQIVEEHKDSTTFKDNEMTPGIFRNCRYFGFL